MDDWTDIASLREGFARLWLWFGAEVLTLDALVQIATVPLAVLLARALAPRLSAWLVRVVNWHAAEGTFRPLRDALIACTLPLLWLGFQILFLAVILRMGLAHHVLDIVVRLLLAWIIIRLATALIRNHAAARGIRLVVWTIVALDITGLLDMAMAFLDSLAFSFGAVRISLLGVLRGALALAVLLWVAAVATRLIERRLRRTTSLTPTVQVLFAKLAKIGLMAFAVLVALNWIGVSLTGFAIFSSAIGLGLGFGLQKVVSNLVSGVILLLDRSIKPGDVIVIGDTYGWINALAARYVSITTRDGTEYLIPNEELITQKVENWSHSNNLVRLKAPVGVAYNTDVPRAIALCIEAARETPRVLDNPQPICLLRGFGDNSVDLELRFWISDVPNGVANVTSEVLLRVWQKFHDNGVEFPFPQRDVHVKEPVEVRLRDDTAKAVERDMPPQEAPRPVRGLPRGGS